MQLISTHVCMTKDVGVNGSLFGGITLAWIDEAALAFICQYCDTPRMVTKHMEKVDFNCPVRVGQIAKIYGEIKRIGTRSATVSIEVRRHSVYNGSQKIVCSTDVTFVRIDGDGEAIPVADKVRDKFNKKK